MKFKFSFLFLFFILNLVLVAQDLKVISSDFNSITIEYRPSVKDTISISQDGQSFIKLVIPGTVVENSSAFGIPQLLVRAVNIGVQGEYGNTIQILSSSYTTLNGRYIANPFIGKDSLGKKESYRLADAYNSFKAKEIVTFGEYGLMRNLPIQSINIYPVQFDASLNSIKIYSKIVFKINIGSSTTAKVKIDDDSFQASVLNWVVAKNWGIQKTSLSKIANSTLATGNWYRFETPAEGIYKIDRTFLQNLGIDLSTSNFDPRTIKIYGYGGAALPEDLSRSNNTGMIENAITVIGEQDGSFDAADYILFYGRGIEFFEYTADNRSVVRKKNPFSAKNYYWLTYGGSTGKRMEAKNSLTVSNAAQQITTQAFISHEKDSVNLGKTGREYFGEMIDGSIRSRTFINSLSGLYPNSSILYQVRVAAKPDVNVFTYQISESGNEIGSASFVPLYDYDIARDDEQKISYSKGLTDERSVLKFSVTTSSSAKIFLDYFIISYQKYLRAVNDNLLVFAKDTTANIDYSFTNFSSSSIQVFDVTDFSNVKAVSGGAISGGQYRFISSETAGKPSKYLGVTSSAFKTPSNVAKVDNSNIRGTVSGSELIVITVKDFKTQAERYAKYRSSEAANKFSTQIFYVDEIMNEFSGGVTDPTAIRDFLKFAYDNWKIKPFYVLLFGDASYDILNTVSNNKNFIPAYESQASLNGINSYPTDDYYGRVSGNDYKLDLAIGRLTIQSTKEAEVAVDKIINYETVQSKGDWRNKITLVADDGWTPSEDNQSLHTGQSEDLAENVLPKTLSQDKIYLVAYPTEFIGSGRRKPGVNTAIINAINNGTLILNYIGHGSPELWADEQVFVKASTIPQLVNKNYFFLTVASCDFGWYDDPEIQSSTETMMALPTSGCILAFSASRVSYSNYNALLNDTLYACIFKARDINNLPIPVGKAYLLAKQYSTGDIQNDEKYELFGDPTIRLNLPTLPVQIDSINGKTTSTSTQISALSKIKVKGSIRDASGKINAMNGEVILTVYDSNRSIFYPEINYTVSQQGGLIFKGRASLTNGLYETEFMVPKDISYENEKGKMVAYVSNNLVDGIGYTNNFTVGGTSQTTVNDGKGPEIEIYFDDSETESSYLVNPDFTLHAKLKDQTGLNTTGSGIGHKLEAILNNDLTNSIDLTSSFVGDLNSGGKSGNVSYSFTNMTPGDYKLRVKAWDVFNNFSYQDAMFTVVESSNGIVIRDVVNYPNPFTSNTTFTFKHNYGSGINLKIKVYTVAGRLIKTIENFSVMDKFVRTDWDGRDEDGNQLANGTYLYKLIVDSIDGSFHDAVLGKLAIVR